MALDSVETLVYVVLYLSLDKILFGSEISNLRDFPQRALCLMLEGEVFQQGLPDGETWYMPLPIVLHFQGSTMTRGNSARPRASNSREHQAAQVT